MIITLTKERVEELVSPDVDVSSKVSPYYLIAVSDAWTWTKCALKVTTCYNNINDFLLDNSITLKQKDH